MIKKTTLNPASIVEFCHGIFVTKSSFHLWSESNGWLFVRKWVGK